MNQILKKAILMPFDLLYKINPKITLKILFFLKQGYKLDLNTPKTFNEKLNWMKLHYRNDLMPLCTDKYTVRDYVKKVGCEEILNDIIWEGHDPNLIPFENLPSKFVIKVTTGSGRNIICKKKRN